MLCKQCQSELSKNILKKNTYICPKCGLYTNFPAIERIQFITDDNSFREYDAELCTNNNWRVEGYEDTLANARARTGLDEAIITGVGTICGRTVAIGVMDSAFMMASMGQVVGEKITRLFERAIAERLPIILFCCSGGARMQEGLYALMQMEKTAAVVKRHSDEGLFYLSILTDPTMGGVSASFALIADINLAEPRARVGFAGKRVIAETIGEELPQEFQTAEFLEKHGMIDGIIRREKMQSVIDALLKVNTRHDRYDNFSNSILKSKIFGCLGIDNKKQLKNDRTAYEKVRYIRNVEYPVATKFIDKIFDFFIEQKGDRCYGNDKAVVGGIASLCGQPITVITEYRGEDLAESVSCNFGMPQPEGYRKTLRLMKQADKFNRPIINFLNTSGAHCGVDAEKRGQALAIAEVLSEASGVRVPILSIIVGEAGSGGALAFACGNEVWMLEGATYSILSPEGYAAILWRDATRSSEAADAMRMTSEELLSLGIIDKVIPDYGGISNDNIDKIAHLLKGEIISFLRKISKKSRDEVVSERFNRFRNY